MATYINNYFIFNSYDKDIFIKIIISCSLRKR